MGSSDVVTPAIYGVPGVAQGRVSPVRTDQAYANHRKLDNPSFQNEGLVEIRRVLPTADQVEVASGKTVTIFNIKDLKRSDKR